MLVSLPNDHAQVDAICIDQTNDKERGAQVLLMQGIYAGAQGVVVATDAADIPAQQLLPVLKMANAVLSVDNQDPKLAAVTRDTSVSSALSAFCNDMYWKRIWIIQDVAIGHTINLLIDDTIVDVRNLEVVLKTLSLKHISAQVDAVSYIRRSRASNRPINLLDILRETYSSLCGYRHDRVFGLLGLVTDHLDFLSQGARSTQP
jgi:hypothetical protein